METESLKLDAKDLDILRALQQDARLSNKELALKVHLSTTPTYERVKRLERSGIIRRYTAVLDANMLNRGFTVFCSIKLRRVNREMAFAFTEMIKTIPEVTECYNISGAFDYLLRIQAKDMKTYQEFLLNVIGSHENIASIQSTFVMEEIKFEYGVPIV